MATTYNVKSGQGYKDPIPPASYSKTGQIIYLRGFSWGVMERHRRDAMEVASRRYTLKCWQRAFAEGFSEAKRQREARGDW